MSNSPTNINTTNTMQALVLESPQGAFKPRMVPRPRPEAGQVLVRIHASGVNPLDTKIRAGAAAHAQHPLPAVLGMDLAGVVDDVGPGVSRVQVGDEVYGFTGGIGGLQGSLAQYAAVDVRLIARKPANLTMREAAAVPLVFITAWEGLVDRANVRSGHKVLVHGGAGGVGHMAVQLARARGADVFATGTAAQAGYIRSIGATPIDHETTSVEAYVHELTDGQGFDVVYDTVGGPILDASFLAVRRYSGHVVTALGWGTHQLAPLSFRGATFSGVFTLLPILTGQFREHHGEILEQATLLAESGQLKPLLDPQMFTLDTAGEAHALVAEGRARGKVVVSVPA
ncbi:MAG: zinc-dependent alcohol dehydrogenase family protein [Pseudomonadota bacterium]